MAYSRKDVDKTKQNAKKFVRYQEGAEKYSMGLTKFTALAKEAKAVYKIDKVTLVNCEIFERYLESVRIPQNSHFTASLILTNKTPPSVHTLCVEAWGRCCCYSSKFIGFLSRTERYTPPQG